MNVKPGDLVQVVCGALARATGTVTETIPLAAVPPRFRHHGVYQMVEFPRPMKWEQTGNSPANVGAVPDAWLRKIGGPDVPTETTRVLERQQ